MERCDFSSIITTFRKYISDDRGMPPCFMNLYTRSRVLLGEDLETFREQAYQKRALWKMERRKKQPVQLKKKVHDHER